MDGWWRRGWQRRGRERRWRRRRWGQRLRCATASSGVRARFLPGLGCWPCCGVTGAVVRFGVRFLATPAGDVVGDWSTVPRPMIVSVGAASEGERTKRMAAGTSKKPLVLYCTS